MPEPCRSTTSSNYSPRAGHRRKARIAARRRRSDMSPRPSANGSYAGCEGSRSQVFLDPRDVLLDRDFRLLRLGCRREAHDEERFAAGVEDEVLVRLRVDHDGLERILRLI